MFRTLLPPPGSVCNDVRSPRCFDVMITEAAMLAQASPVAVPVTVPPSPASTVTNLLIMNHTVETGKFGLLRFPALYFYFAIVGSIDVR